MLKTLHPLDTTHLNSLRNQYAYCRRSLGACNRQKVNVSALFQVMNACRKMFKDEINRLSWELWPETGRPKGKS